MNSKRLHGSNGNIFIQVKNVNINDQNYYCTNERLLATDAFNHKEFCL